MHYRSVYYIYSICTVHAANVSISRTAVNMINKHNTLLLDVKTCTKRQK